MKIITVTATRLGRTELALIAWALVSFGLALLPPGAGGPVRAVNAVVFMCFGPGLAMMLVLLRSLIPAVAAVVAFGTSLGVLVVSSQALLILGMWRAWGVTGLVALATVTLTVLPSLPVGSRAKTP